MRGGRSVWFLLAALLSVPAWAQKKSGLKIDVPTVLGFSAPIAGEDGRTVALVSGAKMTPSLASGEMEITGFRLETFRYAPDRTTELVVESPLGRFGPQGAGSGERMTLKSADGRFAISGTGWSWGRTTSMLVISNAVETTLRRETAETNRPPISVRARRFEYHLRTGDARFVEDCVAEDPGRARVSGGELRSRLSPSQTRPESILGTQGVTIELLRGKRPGRARGAQAEYTAATEGREERIVVSGETTWRFGDSEGAADRLTLLPGLDAYTAQGHALLKLRPRGKAGASSPEASSSREALEIACETIDAKATNVVLVGPVVARQGDRFEVKAARLEAVLGPDPKTEETTVHFAKATGGVSARVGKDREAIALRGDAMAYTLGETSWIEMTGSPGWEGQGHSGTAEWLRIRPDAQGFEGRNNVQVRWESPARGTNGVPVLLSAETMDGDDRRVVFAGGVRASGDRWNLGARDLEMTLGTNRTVRGILATNDVRFLYRMLPLRPGTNSTSKTMLRHFGDGKVAETLDWDISAGVLRVGWGPRESSRGDDLTSLEASGGVDVKHVGLKARGGRLTYASEDGLLRLSDHAEIHAVDGMDVVGQPETTLTVNPRTGVLGVEGPVRKWVLPAAMLRGTPAPRPAVGP